MQAKPPTTSSPSTSMSLGARAAFILLPFSALGALLWFVATYPLPAEFRFDWVPGLGVELAWRLDGLTVLLLLLITGIGTAVFVYAGGYLAGHPQQNRLFVLLALFMLAMIGTVSSDNLLVVFFFWEMTSITSFALVGFNHTRLTSRKSAQQALLVTAGGGLFLLAGFILLSQIMGSSSISTIVAALPNQEPSTALTVALLLILVGAFTKSAQFPFHFWLPNAMAAPTPVSAYLHSATMVKLGVYLLARFDPGFGHLDLWVWILTGVGSITAAWGMILTLRERDLKRILAWSTVATLGTLTALIGLRAPGAATAVALLLLAHALYKAPLFFVAGNIEHGTGSRNIDCLGNVRTAMPWTAAAALLAGVSMAGIPLSFGFIAKDVVAALAVIDYASIFFKHANTMFGVITVAVVGIATVRVFWWRPGSCITPQDVHECDLSLVAPPLALASTGILFGLFPAFVQSIIGSAATAMSVGAQLTTVELALNLSPAFLGSMALYLVLGIAIFLLWDFLHHRFELLIARYFAGAGVANQYELVLGNIARVSALVTRWLQHGNLPGYLQLVVAGITLPMAAVLIWGWGSWSWPAWTEPSLGVIGACVLIAIGAILATVVRERLVLLLVTGLVGFGCAIFFLFVGAPDVAFTQFTVEVVFVIVVASVLLKIKLKSPTRNPDEPIIEWGALSLSLAFGAVLTLTLLIVTANPFNPALSDFFGTVSVLEAYGRNVVNVILVDFRALDTLGEIAVILFSLLAAISVLQTVRKYSANSSSSPKSPRSPTAKTARKATQIDGKN